MSGSSLESMRSVSRAPRIPGEIKPKLHRASPDTNHMRVNLGSEAAHCGHQLRESSCIPLDSGFCRTGRWMGFNLDMLKSGAMLFPPSNVHNEGRALLLRASLSIVGLDLMLSPISVRNQ